MDIPTKSIKMGDLLFKPSIQRENRGVYDPIKKLVIAEACVRVRGGEIPVRIANYERCEITIHKGTTIGELLEVQMVSNHDVMEGVKLYDKTIITGANLTEVEKRKLQQLIDKYEDVVAKHEYDVIEHEIRLTDDIPLKLRNRRMPYKLEQEAKRQLKHMGNYQCIRPSMSSYRTFMVPVTKKDGEVRLCTDYRELNKKTNKDVFPLPNIQEIFDKLNGARYFTKLDLNK